VADIERVTTLETKVKVLEARIEKVECSVDKKATALSEIDTKLQLLGQKLDTFIESIKAKSEEKKFNWAQGIAVIAIVASLGGIVWSQYYLVQKTIEHKDTAVQFVLSDMDLNHITKAVEENMYLYDRE